MAGDKFAILIDLKMGGKYQQSRQACDDEEIARTGTKVQFFLGVPTTQQATSRTKDSHCLQRVWNSQQY